MEHKLWEEKYRPSTLDGYVFQNPTHEVAFRQMVTNKSIPHLLLSGMTGSGKTTMAKILIAAMNVDELDVLTINASDERGIDTFRELIKGFATSFSIGEFKIVHLEEADELTQQAQKALKAFMDEAGDFIRFIFTCNDVNRLVLPIRSRCHQYFFKAADLNDITEMAINILVSEHITFTIDVLDKIIAMTYPDVRKMIITLQQNSVSGTLTIPVTRESVVEYKIRLLELIESNKWIMARKLVCDSVSSNEWEDLYRFLYTNIHKSPKFQQRPQWEEAILTIADHLYKHSIVADPEINCAACFIKLGQIT